jgi:maltose alpha-D-glucosyltransferase/alpha-amylase
MSRYLTERGFANAPPLLGEVCHVDKKGERHSLAVAQGFVRNQGDAWTWMLDRFNRALDDLATQEAAARADDVADYLAIAGIIGQRLGEMHAVLAQPSDDPAFAPQRTTSDDAAVWLARAAALLSRALNAIRAHKTWDDEASAAQANRLLPQEELIVSALRRRAETGVGSVMTRIHGDFHLGQVLVASGDVHIIDFEGEPARPLKERRAKTSPLRDVAGLLRSLDYAAATLVPKAAAAAALPDEARRAFIMRLRDSAREAFLAAYRAATNALPGLDNAELLDFFLIEKAAYEVAYEAANRPAWLPIPMDGLANLAARVTGRSRRAQ